MKRSSEPLTTTVGEYGRIAGQILPGTILRAKEIRDPRPKLVVRLAAIYPHGTSHRYDLEYYGLEPGTYDLCDFLERVDGGPTGDLPAIPVRVRSLLPVGQILPHELSANRPPPIGGYSALAVAATIAWLAGLAVILLARRRRTTDETDQTASRTLADYLRPRLEAARNGHLSSQQYAELERWIVEAWRRRLGLRHLSTSNALIQLRRDTTAGPALQQLEQWLHQPQAASNGTLAEILAPYQDWPLEDEPPETDDVISAITAEATR